tara:strand:- start:39139 stop:39621 length:483 start_codon:yes stop_codon:yes gene_type:complete
MLRKLISGGQTGIDRGALDAALSRAFPCGGWCPRGRRAEDGPIPARYPLTELDSANYLDRTRRNVAEADATLILAHGPLSGGTKATEKHARKTGKRFLTLDLDGVSAAQAVARICAWIETERIGVLNVAGPRESSRPGTSAAAADLLGAVLDRVSSSSRS